MTKISFGVIVLNGEPFTKYCLRSLYPFAHEIIVVEGATINSRHAATQDGHSTDGTLAALREFKEREDPEGKLTIVTKDGFWTEKDEQSQAYADRATGDYLWQVDIDEFYKAGDMARIIEMLDKNPGITAVSFKQLTFWGSPAYRCDSVYLMLGAEIYHRLFRFKKGCRYVTHRPPTVVDEWGRDLRNIKYIDGARLADEGIYLYHYSLLFLKQVREKVEYYSKMRYTHSEGLREWAETDYFKITNPYRAHNVYNYPGWLERYGKDHPEQAMRMWEDVRQGILDCTVRDNEDVERLLGDETYLTGVEAIKNAVELSISHCNQKKKDSISEKLKILIKSMLRKNYTVYSLARKAKERVHGLTRTGIRGVFLSCLEKLSGGDSAYRLLNRTLEKKRHQLENASLPVMKKKPMEEIEALLFSTTDCLGGASKVAWWLHEGLKKRGHGSSMAVGRKLSRDKDVCTIKRPVKDRAFLGVCNIKGLQYSNNLSTFDIVDLPAFRKADVLHFHNLHGNYFNPLALPGLTRLKPAVWTLHDMQAFTGNCAVPISCERWRDGCGDCRMLDAYPVLKSDTTAEMLRTKKMLYEKSEFDVVVPSKWLMDIAADGILGSKRLHLIHNGVDTSVFYPGDKEGVKSGMGIPASMTVYITTVTGGIFNPYKGGRYLLDAVERLAQGGTRAVIIAVGMEKGFDPGINGIRWINTGHVKDEKEIARLYSSADLLLLPTLADNFPLVVLEAMACGLPVVTFDTGGVPEQVLHKVTGYVAGYKDVDDFVAGVRYFMEDGRRIKEASEKAVARVRENFTLDNMVDRYLELYREVIERRRVSGGVKARPSAA